MTNAPLPSARRWRTGSWILPSMLLAAVGCGFPHDRYGSDPMFGAFLRPIAPTPPIWTGQDPGASPAYDGGARIGLPSPDVPNRTDSPIDRWLIVPTYSGSLGIGGSGNRSATSGGDNQPSVRKTPFAASGAVGAHLLPSTTYNDCPAVAVTTRPSTGDSVMPRPVDTHTLLTSGAAIEPAAQLPKPFSPALSMKDPRSVYSVDEAQAILQTCGARQMTMEPQPTGAWRFSCTISDGAEMRRYEAQNSDAIEAVRTVMWQVKNQQ